MSYILGCQGNGVISTRQGSSSAPCPGISPLFRPHRKVVLLCEVTVSCTTSTSSFLPGPPPTSLKVNQLSANFRTSSTGSLLWILPWLPSTCGQSHVTGGIYLQCFWESNHFQTLNSHSGSTTSLYTPHCGLDICVRFDLIFVDITYVHTHSHTYTQWGTVDCSHKMPQIIKTNTDCSYLASKLT